LELSSLWQQLMKPEVGLPKLASMNHHHNSKMLKENINKSVPPCFNMRIDSIRKAQNKPGIVFCCHPKHGFLWIQIKCTQKFINHLLNLTNLHLFVGWKQILHNFNMTIKIFITICKYLVMWVMPHWSHVVEIELIAF